MTTTRDATQHTPGPWGNNKWNCDEHQISANGGTIALVSHGHTLVSEDEADANARLIAAAPELLQCARACEQAIDLWLTEGVDADGVLRGLRLDLLRERMKQARAAISKATGGQ